MNSASPAIYVGQVDQVLAMLVRLRKSFSKQLPLFTEKAASGVDLSVQDMEALMCLALVSKLEAEVWKKPLDSYCEESRKQGCPTTPLEVEAVFFCSLFYTLKPAVWLPVVQTFHALKAQPLVSLRALGFR